VYDKTCVACHAHRRGQRAEVRRQGRLGAAHALPARRRCVASVVKGKGAMPPKAGAGDLKDDDIKAAVDYMLAAAK
jgi:cytochrome c5